MTAIAPNLTYMVGELVGARLISQAGSLMSLAKHPSSTVQILGAEKAPRSTYVVYILYVGYITFHIYIYIYILFGI